MVLVCGDFFNGKEMVEGYLDTEEGIFHQGVEGRKEYTCIRAPVNAHTHLGDSFIMDEPVGTLAEIVGPGGFKHTHLANTNVEKISQYMEESIEFMKRSGTHIFFDFRETGNRARMTIETIRNHSDGIVLARPENIEDFKKVLDIIHGIGFSAVSDMNMDYARSLSEFAHKNGKIVASHFSENRVESLENIGEIKPDFLVHCTALDKKQLMDLYQITENIAVTPRSNRFFNIESDYRKFLDNGFNLCLGTDNAMICLPDLFGEMEFLYRIQKNVNRISPEEILEMATINPYKMLETFHIEYREKWLCFKEREMTPYSIIRSSGKIPFIQIEANPKI